MRRAVMMMGLVLSISGGFAGSASAHSGGTDRYGCHAGSRPYHCHGGGGTPAPGPSTPTTPSPAPPVATPTTPPPTGARPPVALVLTPTSITAGAQTEAKVTGAPGEALALYSRVNSRQPWKLLRTGTAGPTGRKGWFLRPDRTMTFRARPIGASHSRDSGVITVTVRARPSTAPACSASSIRTSHEDSARCLFRSYERGDWDAVANYALPPVVGTLRSWRPYDVRTGFRWTLWGCRQPIFGSASSGVACNFSSPFVNGEPPAHGMDKEFGMDRHFRAESVTTVG